MKKLVLFVSIFFACTTLQAQVGIGTATPNTNALLHVEGGTTNTKGLLVTGTYNSSATVPDLGTGSRLMYYPGKAAFRAGYVNGTEWNNANVGFYSVAIGYNTTASGSASTAMGFSTSASGVNSTATGYNTTASGNNSTAMGQGTIASGIASTAMGYNTTASGFASTVMGYQTTASGNYSTAFGFGTTASGDFSTAMGLNVNTNSQSGSFYFGDSDPNGGGILNSTAANQFSARFNGGYYFISKKTNTITLGVQVAPGGNSWSAISDVRRKENFLPVNEEDVLKKIGGFQLTTWNYKGQSAKTFRHYGPMAQDFYAAFGKDAFGTIGCDTLINQQDFLGVSFIAIQALEKRTAGLKNENEKIKIANAEIKKENESLKQSIAQLEKKLDEQQKLLVQSMAQINNLVQKQNKTEVIVAKN